MIICRRKRHPTGVIFTLDVTAGPENGSLSLDPYTRLHNTQWHVLRLYRTPFFIFIKRRGLLWKTAGSQSETNYKKIRKTNSFTKPYFVTLTTVRVDIGPQKRPPPNVILFAHQLVLRDYSLS